MSQPLIGPVLKDLHTLDEHLLLREETGLDIDVVLDATSVCLVLDATSVWSWGLEAHCQKGTLVNLRIMPWFVFLQHLWTLIYISMRTHNIIVIIIIVFATPHLDSDVAMSHLLKASWLKYYKGSRLCILDSPWHGVPSPRSSPLIAAIVWCAGKKRSTCFVAQRCARQWSFHLWEASWSPLNCCNCVMCGEKKDPHENILLHMAKEQLVLGGKQKDRPKRFKPEYFFFNPVLLYGVAPWTP